MNDIVFSIVKNYNKMYLRYQNAKQRIKDLEKDNLELKKALQQKNNFYNKIPRI